MRRQFPDDSGGTVTVTLDEEQGLRYKYKGGYVTIGIETLRLLMSLSLPKDAFRVVLWLWAHLEYKNIIPGATSQRIGDECDARVRLDRQRVGKMLRLLEQAGMVQRREKQRGTVYLNPARQFRGTPAQQRLAIREWNEYAQAHPQLTLTRTA